jgi:hypothetical protein
MTPSSSSSAGLFGLSLVLGAGATSAIAHADEVEDARREVSEVARSESPVRARFDAGYSQRSLLTVPVRGAEAGAAIGRTLGPWMAVWIAGRFSAGATTNGLNVLMGSLGVDLDLVLGRFRLECGPRLYVDGVERVSRSWVSGWSGGGHVGLRGDVVRTPRAWFFLAVDGVLSELGGGGTFGAGVDFQIVR